MSKFKRKLLRCPFCNSKKLSPYLGEGQNEFWAAIQCNNCMAQGSITHATTLDIALRFAHEKWNTRDGKKFKRIIKPIEKVKPYVDEKAPLANKPAYYRNSFDRGFGYNRF